MPTHVALVRAINVGGRAIVRMDDLRATFERAGGAHVRTYIQSGNVFFDAPARSAGGVAQKAAALLGRTLGKEPAIVVRRSADICALVEANPFVHMAPGPAVKLYVAFLAGVVRGGPSLPFVSASEAVEVVAAVGQDLLVVSRPKKNGMFGFPNGVIEEEFGVLATTRNWTTVSKIAGQLCASR